MTISTNSLHSTHSPYGILIPFNNIREWTGLEWNKLLWKAENREEWRKLAVKSTVVPQRSARLRDR